MVVAALAGALGAAGVLLARERLVLLAGLALLGVAEAALVLDGGSFDSLSSVTALGGGVVGVVALGAAAALLRAGRRHRGAGLARRARGAAARAAPRSGLPRCGVPGSVLPVPPVGRGTRARGGPARLLPAALRRLAGRGGTL